MDKPIDGCESGQVQAVIIQEEELDAAAAETYVDPDDDTARQEEVITRHNQTKQIGLCHVAQNKLLRIAGGRQVCKRKSVDDRIE